MQKRRTLFYVVKKSSDNSISKTQVLKPRPIGCRQEKL